MLAILGIFSINLGPLIAGAGIAGIAVGLGAQQLVKDCIAGFFILLEDQCGVGDEIDIGPAIGTVESITLRATTLRDGAGTVWTVPNGTVLRIGNKSRDWSQGTVDVTVADPSATRRRRSRDRASRRRRVGRSAVAPLLLEPIAVPGVENLGTMGPAVRVTVRTSAGDEGRAMRTLRATLMREHRGRRHPPGDRSYPPPGIGGEANRRADPELRLPPPGQADEAGTGVGDHHVAELEDELGCRGHVEVVADALEQPLGIRFGVGVQGGDVEPGGRARPAAGCVASARESSTAPPPDWRPGAAAGRRRGGTRTAV